MYGGQKEDGCDDLHLIFEDVCCVLCIIAGDNGREQERGKVNENFCHSEQKTIKNRLWLLKMQRKSTSLQTSSDAKQNTKT